MAGDALTACASIFVARMLCDGRSVRSGRRRWPVAIKAEPIGRFAQLRVISRTMNVMAVETCDATTLHYALHEIVALHAVLVCGAVWIVEEIRGLAKSVVLQLPVIG
jgi:hypothetical protein